MNTTIQTIHGNMVLDEDCLVINTENKSEKIPINRINDAKIIKKFHVGRLSLMIKTHTGATHTCFVKNKDRTLLVEFVKTIHHLAKIHVYEEKTCRSHVRRSSTLYDYLPLIVAGPLIIIQLVVAVFLLYTPVGVFLTPPLAILAILILEIIYRASFGNIEGHCPICNKPVKTTKYTKHITCKFCMHQILIHEDYFEVIVRPSYFEELKEEPIDGDDYDDEIDDGYYR